MKNLLLVVVMASVVGSCAAMEKALDWCACEFVTPGIGTIALLEKAKLTHTFSINDLESLRHGLELSLLVYNAEHGPAACFAAAVQVQSLLSDLETAESMNAGVVVPAIESMRNIISWGLNDMSRLASADNACRWRS